MAIAENIELKDFKISWSNFHSKGAAALAKGFRVSVFLTVFPAVALAAEEQLPWAKLLKPAKEELSAGNNHISTEGAVHIAAGLKENKTLKRLNVISSPRKDIPVNEELAERCDAVKVLLLHLLLRYGGNMKLQRKCQLKVELRNQPEVAGNPQNTVAENQSLWDRFLSASAQRPARSLSL
ncbi:hypothetical protein Q9233_010446 [Columba guinea]|nr:hypothetical protein Q9233_010446 [Columba guinea]